MNKKRSNLLKLIPFIGLALILSSSKLKARSPQLGVTHPQVKETIEDMARLYNWDLKVELAFSFKGSAHEFEPSVSDLKSLMRQEFLLAGPIGHQKWLVKAKSYLPEKTTFLTGLAQDHFWLNADLGCSQEKEIIKALTQWKLISPDSLQAGELWCPRVVTIKNQLEKLLKDRGIKRVILAHNALKSQLESMNLEVLVLFHDDHHSKISSHKIKQALSWQNDKESRNNLLQIKEPEILWPSPLKDQKVRSIIWSPLQKSPLKELVETLRKLEEKKS